MTALPSGTVTFLFSDIEGSTRLMQRLGDRWGDVLADQRRLLRESFAARDGREVDMQGDAFFFAFARARDAVDAALEAQRALAGYAWPDGVEVRVRMGLHTGEPAVGEEGYLGIDVVRAARLCAVAHGGQVLMSGTTRALLGPEAPAGVELRDLGRHTLKDIEYAEHVFQAVAPDLPAEFGELRTSESATPAPFAGRERELADEARAVADDLGAAIRRRVYDELRRKGISLDEERRASMTPDMVSQPTAPPDTFERVATGGLILAGFSVVVIVAGVVAVMYLVLR